MIKVAIHQPNFFPWMGYFHKIASCNIFVYLDDVQFSNGSVTGRTKIMVNDRPSWLSVPINWSFGNKINEVKVKQGWKAKILDNLYEAYAKKPHFENCWEIIKNEIEETNEQRLDKINIRLINFISKKLGFGPKIRISSELKIKSFKDDRLVDILKKISSKTIYLSGKGATKYQDTKKFIKSGIVLHYQEFKENDLKLFKKKSNTQGPIDNKSLSILDAVFNHGWDQTAKMIINNGKFSKAD